VDEPWMIDGWKPVCQPCFDTFRAQSKVKVIEKESVPEMAPRGVEALSPNDEPYVMLYPEDAMLLEGQPEPWKKLWEKSQIKNALEKEAKWPKGWDVSEEDEIDKI
jgi:hypothetical protein